ncbi:MAG: Rid family detoxifying hydrolase [Myxococcota bacterium]|jgi:2-iminobutanoate/2-iminopropanoate deaminase|nr:Rid family detoxifying hydrolase [Myxococcota bacterium]
MDAARRAIATSAAPAAIGPYSQAIAAGGLLFLSGQIPLDPVTGAMVGETAAAQARQVLANLRAVLAAAGCTPDDLLQVTIYLSDLGDFAEVNAAYAELFTAAPPARATVQVARLPRDAKVEIGGIAQLPPG